MQAVPSIYPSVLGAVDLYHESTSASHHDFVVSLLARLGAETRRSLALENLALRQQLAVLHHSVKRPRLSDVDRGFWVLLRRIWTDWDRVLVIVKP